MTKLIFTMVLIVFLLFILQKIPQTKLAERPINLLSNGFIRAIFDLATRFLAHSVCITIPLGIIGLLSIIEMSLYIFSFATLAILISPELAIDEKSELVITKKAFSNSAEIHLRNPYQNFTMRTYKELLYLVENLPNNGVKRFKLCSPMFYHFDGTLRDFSTLEKLLSKKNATLSTYEAKPWQNLLGKISMMIDSAKDKKERIRKINLNKWHIIKIKLRG